MGVLFCGIDFIMGFIVYKWSPDVDFIRLVV